LDNFFKANLPTANPATAATGLPMLLVAFIKSILLALGLVAGVLEVFFLTAI
jgi:hypothetical protein